MNIVICYDGTKSAKAAIKVGVQMCKAFNAEAHIVNSVIIDDQSEKFEFIEDDSTKEHKTLTKAKLLMGSTAQHAVLKAHCPVVTIAP